VAAAWSISAISSVRLQPAAVELVVRRQRFHLRTRGIDTVIDQGGI